MTPISSIPHLAVRASHSIFRPDDTQLALAATPGTCTLNIAGREENGALIGDGIDPSFNGKPKASVSSRESCGFPEKQSPAACR